MSSAFGPVEQPAEQAMADQVVAAVKDLAALAVRGHVAIHTGDQASVERTAREMFALAEEMSRPQALNVIIALANLTAAVACGDADLINGHFEPTVRVVR